MTARAIGERGRPPVRHSGGVVRPAPNTEETLTRFATTLD